MNVEHPEHYTKGKIETIDAIESIVIGYEGIEALCVGNIVKYLARAPFKGKKDEDFLKAKWYLEHLIGGEK